jgi:hypothetical protein
MTIIPRYVTTSALGAFIAILAGCQHDWALVVFATAGSFFFLYAAIKGA